MSKVAKKIVEIFVVISNYPTWNIKLAKREKLFLIRNHWSIRKLHFKYKIVSFPNFPCMRVNGKLWALGCPNWKNNKFNIFQKTRWILSTVLVTKNPFSIKILPIYLVDGAKSINSNYNEKWQWRTVKHIDWKFILTVINCVSSQRKRLLISSS